MTKTRENLVFACLELLGVAAAGQSPSAEDSQLVNGMVEPTLAKLAAKSIYAYGDPDQIEDECFEDLTFILAVVMAPRFGGVQVDKTRSNEAVRTACQNSLREIGAEKLSGQTLKVDYF